jgi:hypothetical protein
VTLVTLVTRNRTLEEGDYLFMESEWEKEIRELLESLTRVPLEDLLKEIAETPIPFIDYEPIPKARKTRAKRTPESPKKPARKGQ